MYIPHFVQTSVCRVFGSALLSCAILKAETRGFWQATDIGGEQYVAVEQIKIFYNFNKLTRHESRIELENSRVLMELEIDSSKCYLNKLKIILSKPVLEIGNVVHVAVADVTGWLDPILRPDHIAGAGDFKTIILDPASGAQDPESANDLGTEGKFTYKIAKLAKTTLEAKGFNVFLTRSETQDASPEEVLNRANAVKDSAIFIKISFASGPDTTNSIQTYPVARGEGRMKADQFGLASVALSTAVHASLISSLGRNTSDGGIKRGELNIFSKLKHPAILIEADSMTHPAGSRLIANKTYQAAIAAGIADGVKKYQLAISKEEAVPVPVAFDPPVQWMEWPKGTN